MLEERHDGGLSGTRGSNDGYAFSAGNSEVDVLEDRSFGTCGVGKVDILEHDMAGDRRAKGAGAFRWGVIGKSEKSVHIVGSLDRLCNLLS